MQFHERVNANEPRRNPRSIRCRSRRAPAPAIPSRIARGYCRAKSASSAMRCGLTKIGINHTTCRPARNPRCVTGTRTKRNSSSCCRRGGAAHRCRRAGADGRHVRGVSGFGGWQDGDGHQLINRGNEPAVYLEVSNRDRRDEASTPTWTCDSTRADAARACSRARTAARSRRRHRRSPRSSAQVSTRLMRGIGITTASPSSGAARHSVKR